MTPIPPRFRPFSDRFSVYAPRPEVPIVGLGPPRLVAEEPCCAGAVDGHIAEIDDNGIGLLIPVYIGKKFVPRDP